MTPSFLIEHIWEDESMIELRVIASDGLFSGCTQVYTSWIDFEAFADRLEGFPRSDQHVVEEKIGEIGGYSFLRLVFRCTDGNGHAILEVEMEKSQQQRGAANFRPRAKLYCGIEAWAIDEFVVQLRTMHREKSGCARLSANAA